MKVEGRPQTYVKRASINGSELPSFISDQIQFGQCNNFVLTGYYYSDNSPNRSKYSSLLISPFANLIFRITFGSFSEISPFLARIKPEARVDEDSTNGDTYKHNHTPYNSTISGNSVWSKCRSSY